MKLKVTELGIIKDAEIDLSKRLTIFCGPNNTGKTYLSYVLYALNKNIFYNGIKFGNFPNATLDAPSYVTLDIEIIKEVINYTYSSICSNFDSVFGISETQAKQIFDKTKITPIFDDNIGNDILALSKSETIGIAGNKIRFSKDANSLSVKVELLNGSSSAETSDIPDIVLYSALYKFYAFYNYRGTFISPVERNSIYTFNNELSISRNNLIDTLQKGGDFDPMQLIFNNTNRYPVAIMDGLKIANDLNNLQKTISNFNSLADSIESELLNGKLSVTDKGAILFSPDTLSKSKKLPIHMTASIVKTLSSLVFYLRHLAEDGDLIIIDEPEMNLHPDNQLVLVRIFARLINSNFRLLISTHSDYIIRELNNLIMINEVAESKAREINDLGYSIDDKINYKDVNCYFFKFRKTVKRSVTVEKLKIDSSGVTIPSIDETIDSQNRIYEELLYLLNDEISYE